jgi:hypothetical protein
MKKLFLLSFALLLGVAVSAQTAVANNGKFHRAAYKSNVITKEAPSPQSVSPFKSKFSGLKSGKSPIALGIL